MKRFYNTLFLLFLVLSAQAQITILDTDYADVGDRIPQALTNFTDTVGPAGPNQSWNFQFLSALQIRQDTFAVIDPNSLPGDSSFPTANMALKIVGQDAYALKSTSAVDLLGIDLQVPNFNARASFVFTSPVSLIKFPSDFGDKYQQITTATTTFPYDTTINFQGANIDVDSIRAGLKATINSEMDAYGSLRLPNDTQPALRQTLDQKYEITVEAYGCISVFGTLFCQWYDVTNLLPTSPNFTRSTVSYYGKNSKAPLLNFNLDSTGKIEDCFYQHTKPFVTAIAPSLAAENPQVYPNPSEGFVKFQLPGQAPFSLWLYDMQGRLVAEQEDKTAQEADFSELPKGLYLLHIEQNGSRYSSKLQLW